ncbi:MAG: hypothetical protein RL689_984 [Planctomycetota bacterium]|jgi:tRNA threonylcarbamoyladenosine biosynthesis protein TsaE
MNRHKFERITHEVEATEAIGAGFATLLRSGDVVLLDGELGAGKTSFVRGMTMGLGVTKGMASSPTFVLINVYPTSHEHAIDALIHVDAYRVKDIGELENMGWDNLFDPATHAPRGKRAAVIEWPSHIEAALPDSFRCATVRLSHVEASERMIQFNLPGAWSEREGLEALKTRPPVRCTVSKKWVPPTARSYPFADDRARNADLHQWIVDPDEKKRG